MHPILIDLGIMQIATYGALVALGYLSALWYLHSHADAMRIKKDDIFNLALSVILGAMVGGKLLFAILFWSDYGTGFWERSIGVIKDMRYGFVYFGGMAGALSAGFLFVRIKKLKYFKLGDYFAPATALGHAIGRLGCFFAGCCHGHKTHSIFGVKFTNPYCLVSREYLGVPIHPTQLYEVAGNLVLFFILHKMLNKTSKTEGNVLLTYICGYSVLRFVIEFFRGDDRGRYFLSMSPSQWVSVIALLAVIGYLIYVKNKKIQV
jgi:phosphatidylglycerol:prolipoprotein diacylglycerol transferase